jgi:hypothetical protein
MGPYIFNWKTFNKESDIKFTMPAATKKGQNKIIFVKAEAMNYDTRSFSSFYHQAPELLVPFGIEKKDFDDNGKALANNFVLPNKLGRFASMAAGPEAALGGGAEVQPQKAEKYNACLRLSNIVFDKLSESFSGETLMTNYAHFLGLVDKSVKKFAYDNAQQLFGERKSEDVIASMYYPIIKYDPNSVYAPTINARVTLSAKDDAQNTTFFNNKGDRINFSEICEKRNFSVVPILAINGFWCGAKQFGASVQAVQMLVLFSQDAFTSCCISFPGLAPISDEESEAVEGVVA